MEASLQVALDAGMSRSETDRQTVEILVSRLERELLESRSRNESERERNALLNKALSDAKSEAQSLSVESSKAIIELSCRIEIQKGEYEELLEKSESGQLVADASNKEIKEKNKEILNQSHSLSEKDSIMRTLQEENTHLEQSLEAAKNQEEILKKEKKQESILKEDLSQELVEISRILEESTRKYQVLEDAFKMRKAQMKAEHEAAAAVEEMLILERDSLQNELNEYTTLHKQNQHKFSSTLQEKTQHAGILERDLEAVEAEVENLKIDLEFARKTVLIAEARQEELATELCTSDGHVKV